ncbi:hypothetical protein ACNHGM_004838 [Escherichia coli]
MTISVGGVFILNGKHTASKILQLIDNALYEAKMKGKDKVIIKEVK